MHIINTSDLLCRKERVLDWRPVTDWLTGAGVALTGAGGFIGSELSRLVDTLNPSVLTLIDNCEHGLYQVGRTVGPNARLVIADVRDIERLFEVLPGHDVVIHAAALKHVPMCEENPVEAQKTNVGGTINVIRASGNARLIHVSTDKAVRPSSVMGKTKTVAEGLMTQTGRASIVRFGNVIGSSGSVVPLFREQIARGGPVTVTHPGMTRYFMTVGEAAELILQAGAIGPGTYVLDMGTPVSIMQLANDMIRLSGRRDIAIEITGMRGGEKLHEELSTEPLEPTAVDGVMRVRELVG